MKEDRMEYIGYLPICPITPEHPDMLISIPVSCEAKEYDLYVSGYSANTETWD